MHYRFLYILLNNYVVNQWSLDYRLLYILLNDYVIVQRIELDLRL